MAIRGIRTDVSSLPLPKRLDSLTSLRFFAAFAVFTFHFTGTGGETGFGRVPVLFPYSMIGGQGVTFFFVLSGFLMMWVFKPHEHPGVFYWRRVGRIWPAHLVSLLLAIYAYYIMAHLTIDWPSLILSVFLVQTWPPHVYPTLPGNEVTWTLSVELLFYLLFPLLGRLADRCRTRWLVVATALGLAGMWLTNWIAAVNATPATAGWIMRLPVVYLPEFLLGMTVATAVRRGWRLPLRPVVPVLLLAAYVGFYYKGRPQLTLGAIQQVDYTERQAVAIFSVLIILAFVQREIRGLRGVLNTRPLVLLGAWSYCFYLVHHSLSRIATYIWGRLPDNNWALLGVLAVGVVGNVLAWLLFRYVEEPAERWMRRHTPKRWLPPPVPEQASPRLPAPRPEPEPSPEPAPQPANR
ncbi:Peptidoglycan/LPS O-acetylase OafA/YrhL, contains acyltransferase and SGNH-hydrolase domains [Streptomyces sp. DvalAA-14]|nr:Peptidoglycan/LPS O-acetylase OafA/YrhL, contains acyltransferase and SGNH-hydrolase domains [Streptomyces sp. DvalAA-14]